MFACRISSCTTFTSSPFPLRSVAYVCRNVCQPKWPTIPISFAAGSRCALYSEPGQYGSFPPLCGLANTQSSSVGYGLCSRQFHFDQLSVGRPEFRPSTVFCQHEAVAKGNLNGLMLINGKCPRLFRRDVHLFAGFSSRNQRFRPNTHDFQRLMAFRKFCVSVELQN